MSLNKKVVWLPYDMDTAIGINNSGLLVFGYQLEDIDLQEGGEFIFNGQDSVFWTNLRDAFGGDIKAMYQTLRSTGAISYDKVEQMFENHQSKWCEAIFNEDAYFKYIEPLTNPESGKQPDASYLPMAQGSKAEQRKWWLYNRFRYMDSKWNAGDALTDYIMMRAYSVAPQVLTPYADIYLTTAWDGELTQVRARRGQTYTLPCPKDSANDAVVAIYSASQLASVGDLSGLKIKSGNFSMATRLQSLKVGDSDSNYSNTNLTDLQLGNNTLMRVLDVRNCPNLAITVDISGCSNIEEVYFDGTGIAGVVLPNGGVLNTLHLPDSVTNLTVQNQPNITDFVLDDASNLSTLRLENCGELMNDAKNLVLEMESSSRIRLIGINWEVSTTQELSDLYDLLDTMRGLDENGGNMSKAQISGVINVEYYIGNPATMQARYPNVTITYDELETYTVTFMADNKTTILQTVTGVVYGTAAQYTGETPQKVSEIPEEFDFAGWTGDISHVTEDIIVYPLFVFNGSIARRLFSAEGGVDALTYTGTAINKNYAFANLANFKILNLPNMTSIGNDRFAASSNLETINAPNLRNIGGRYAFMSCAKLKTLNMPNLETVGEQSFASSSIEEFEFDTVTYIGTGSFTSCASLKSVKLPQVTLLWANEFNGCSSLTDVYLPSLTNFNRALVFRNCTSLEELDFPSLNGWDTLSNNTFEGCTSLKKIDLAYISSGLIRTKAFLNCSSLIAVIIRSDKVFSLANIDVFNGTKYATDGTGGGYIYVPRAWISSYQAATNWSTLYAAHSDMFRALEDYTVDGTIDGKLDDSKI